MCDGCGRVTTTRPAEGEVGDGWWSLSRDACAGDVPAFAFASFTVVDEPEDGELPEVPMLEEHIFEPPLHFCSLPCLAEWTARAVTEVEK